MKSKQVRGLVKNTGAVKVDLRDWNLNTIDSLAALLKKYVAAAASEALVLTMADAQVWIVVDEEEVGVQFYVENEATYTVSIERLVREFVECYGGSKEYVRRLADALTKASRVVARSAEDAS